MGAKRVKAAVADSGPLIHLEEIGSLSLLRLFEQLHIPQTVWSEATHRDRVAETSLLELDNIERQFPAQKELAVFVQNKGLQTLHAGECESLFVCHQTNVPLILTDDLAVRETAKRLRLTPVGSLGIVIKSYRSELVTLNEAERYIFDLQDISTLFVTRAIVELAVEELHRRTEKR